MKTSSYFSGKVKEKLHKFFDKSAINRTGKASGFTKRKTEKITAYNFVVGFILCCSKQKNTYNEWATQIGLISRETVSRQSLNERIGESAELFAKQLLEETIIKSQAVYYEESLFEPFGQTLLGDSTNLKLPQVLSDLYPGNTSRGEQKAVARIQSIINIKTMKFSHLELCAFTDNDQSASGNILSHVQKGDLVIRDLGYFAIATFKELIDKEVYFLSRLKFGVTISDEKGNIISLKSLMRTGKPIDRWVYIGSKKKIRVRLVMIPLPAAQAAEKRRKARQDRDKRLNHSKEYYQWLGYNVFITTVEDTIWSYAEVAKAYQVRWQIEIIFKSWKSGFHFQKILHEKCTNAYRVGVTIYLLLLFIFLFMLKIYMRYKKDVEKQTGNLISLLKLAAFISTNMLEIFLLSHRKIKDLIARHCCYDKRLGTSNMAELLQSFKN